MPVLLRRVLIGFCCLLPVAVVMITVARYAVNLPYWDDYIVQERLLFFTYLPTGSGKIQALLAQHWEHRIVWTRLVFMLFQKINGGLNYVGLTWIGLGGLVSLLGLLAIAFRRTKLDWAYFMPVPFWLFTLQSHENLIWAMASLQNFWVLTFALSSFWALAVGGPARRVLALGLAIAATFTSGNGPLVLIAGLLVLIWQRHWRSAGGWAICMVVCLGVYFWDYHRISFFPSPYRYPVTDWLRAVLVFVGGFADPYPYSGVYALNYTNPLGGVISLGALVLGMAGWLLWRLIRQQGWQVRPAPERCWSDFFLGSMLFLGATTLITAYSRVGFAGPAYLLQGRYKIYSALIVSIVYLYALTVWPAFWRNRLAIMLGVLTVGMSVFSDYLCLEGIINQRRKAISAYFAFLTQTPPAQQTALARLFHPTEPFLFANLIAPLTDSIRLTQPATKHLAISEQAALYNVAGYIPGNATPGYPDNGTYIILKSPSRTYLVAARPLRSAPLALSGWDGYFSPNQFVGQVLKENLQPDRYRIGTLTHRLGHDDIRMTGQVIEFRGF